MSSGDDVVCEIDFLESRILFVCPNCHEYNVMKIRNSKTDKEDAARQPLPRIGVMRN